MRLLLFEIFIVICVFGKTTISQYNYAFGRNNYCTRVETYNDKIVVPQSRRVLKTYSEFCLSIRFRCTKHRFITVHENKTIIVTKNKLVTECCPGYEERDELCIPICQHNCGHGECAEPDFCLCEPGWDEPYCTSECEKKRFGRGCKNNCTCMHESECDKETGVCHCPKGLFGDSCEYFCPENFYGQDCIHKCECKNDAVCDVREGKCYCKTGYEGQFCENKCQTGRHGEGCYKLCICIAENTESCHHVNGECKCKPGYKGVSCEKECDNFTYGINCSEKCNCVNSEFCDNIDGGCYCKPGWIGATCAEKCPLGKFGENCSFTCVECPNKSDICDHVTGACICPHGLQGDLCNIVVSNESLASLKTENESLTELKGENKSLAVLKSNSSESPAAIKVGIHPVSYIWPIIAGVVTLTVGLIIILGILQCVKMHNKTPIYKRFFNIYLFKKLKKLETGSIIESAISNPAYECTEVQLESEKNGHDFIRGSYSTGVKYFKNNMIDMDNSDTENKKSINEDSANVPDEIKEKENYPKNLNVTKSRVLSDLSAAFMEMKRCSIRKSYSDPSSISGSETDLDFQPEILEEFNTIETIYSNPKESVTENIYSNPKESVTENIYENPLNIKDDTLSGKEPV